MIGLALALALAGPPDLARPPGVASTLPPPPRALYRIAWQRRIVPQRALETNPVEAGGPAVDPGRAGLVVFGTRDGWLHALRPDGRVAWEFQARSGFPAAPAISGDTVYAASSDGRLYALALATGKLLWQYDAKEELGTTPTVAGAMVYVASLQDTVFAVDARTGAWRWHHRRPAPTGFTIRGAARPLERDGVVYAAYSDGYVAALDGGTGQVRWEKQIAPPGPQLDVDSLALEGDRLYAAAYSGAVVSLSLGDGTVQWTFKAPGASRVALAPGLVIAVTVNAVHGLARETGAVLWTTPLGGDPGAAPAVAGGWLLVPAGRGGLKFLEITSGRVLRVLQPGSGVDAAPGVRGRRVYVLSDAGDLYALDLT